ncbi:MAG: hypothetical protein GF331_25120 [Chitinivibrionales bacterium]|nr:hypothetical protein [Chitinivibrionales bacterium]
MKTLRNTTILSALFSFAALAGDPCITISLENPTVRVYEPLMLSIEDTYPCYEETVFGPLGSHASDLVLMIQPPNAEPRPYRAPMQFETVPRTSGGTGQSVRECLILHDHRCLTAKPGPYHFWIADRRALDQVLSNTVTASVVEAVTQEDIDAVNTIAANEAQYAAFVYLKGGEHLTGGFETMQTLAAGRSSYRSLARTLLAYNYCQSFYVGPENKTLREKDPAKVDEFFPDPDDSNVPQSLKQTLAQLTRARFEGQTVPAALTEKIETTLSIEQ